MAIVVLVLLSLLGVIEFSLQGVRGAQGHQQGLYHATHLLERIREQDLAIYLGFSDPITARIPLDAPPFSTDFPANTGYTRRLVTQRLSTDPTNYQFKVYRVEVTVFWKTRGREASVTLEGLTRAP